MPNSAQVKFQEEDRSFFVESPIQGIAAVVLKTKRGKYGVNDELFTSWPQFQRHYGGEAVEFPGVTLAKRALNKGAILRVVKIGHYTSTSNPTSLDAVKAAINETVNGFGLVTGGADGFDILAKNAGADYNNLRIDIEAASNGDNDAFNLTIRHILEPELNEVYRNLKIVDSPSVAESSYLDEIISQSKLVDVVYKDLSGETAPLRPSNGNWAFVGGTNGTNPSDNDYVGDPAGSGLYALNDYDDFDFFTVLDNFNVAVGTAIGAYAAQRQDCRGLIHIPTSNDSVSEVNTFRTSLNVDTRFAYIVTGGLLIRNPFVTTDSSSPLEIPEIGDVLGIAARSAAEYGPWYSFAGSNRGLVTDALGVVNNFAPGGSARLDQLAQRQVNAVVSLNGRIFIKGNFSAQMATSRKSFSSVVGLLIYLKKSLRPTLERFLEEPNDFRTFRNLYNEVDPFLSSLAGEDKRALIDYEWRGDQFANSNADLKVNTPEDLGQGKYRVELWLKETVSLQELTVAIISAPSGITFDDNQ